MPDKRRHLGILKKVSLEGLAEGWGADCFLAVTPMTYVEWKELQTIDEATTGEDDAFLRMAAFVKGHYAGGKVMIVNEDGDLEVAIAQVEDIDALPPETVRDLFNEISGASVDPKDSAPDQSSKSEPTPEPKPTKTQ